MKEKIKFEFVKSGFFTRYPCHVCGGCTEKVYILCEVTKGECQGLRICEICLHAGQEKVDSRLRAQIKELEKRTACLRSLVGFLEIPSYAAWEKAEKKADEDYVRECYPSEWRKMQEQSGGEAVN